MLKITTTTTTTAATTTATIEKLFYSVL